MTADGDGRQGFHWGELSPWSLISAGQVEQTTEAPRAATPAYRQASETGRLQELSEGRPGALEHRLPAARRRLAL